MSIKKPEDHLTPRQYRSLRKLAILWLKTIASKKHPTIKNMLIFGLIVSNCTFLYLLNVLPSTHALEVQNVRKKYESRNISIYTLATLPSISKEKHSLENRFNIAYKKYVKDKSRPDYTYYNPKSSRKVLKWWYNSCINQLRRILNMQSRIADLNKITFILNPNKEHEINDIIRKKGYEETLADMSNYYSRFVPLETYKYLVRTTD